MLFIHSQAQNKHNLSYFTIPTKKQLVFATVDTIMREKKNVLVANRIASIYVIHKNAKVKVETIR